MLDYIKSVLNLPFNREKYDCYGSELEMFLKVFNHVWKQSVTLKCSSPFCPNSAKTYYGALPVIAFTQGRVFLDRFNNNFLRKMMSQDIVGQHLISHHLNMPLMHRMFD
jgi:hypothetical protein